MSNQPNLKIEYSVGDSVDGWQQDPLMDHNYPHRSSPQYYDELHATNRVGI